MTDDRGTLREIDWRSIFPWLIIFRTFRIATSMPILFLATLGALLTPVGWQVSESLFVDVDRYQGDFEFRRQLEFNRRWPGQRGTMPAPRGGAIPRNATEIVTTTTNTLEPVYRQFVTPVASIFGLRIAVAQAAYYLFGLLWMMAVWGFFGGAINRIAVVWLGAEERIGMGAAVRYARRKYVSYFTSPLFPLFGVLLTAVPCVLAGLLMRMDWGVAVVGIGWIFAVLSGLVMVLFLLGLLFGWPLMWGAVSAEENGDAFEAFSRSYSYTFQRPLHYLFYALVATIFGSFCWLLVYHFSESVIQLTNWSIRLGTGIERWDEMVVTMHAESTGKGMLTVGGAAIGYWTGLVRTIAAGFGYSFFWCVAAAVYLLLRRQVDHTEFDNVYVENYQDSYTLPSLTPETTDSETAQPSEPAQPSEDANPANQDETPAAGTNADENSAGDASTNNPPD